MCRDSTNTYTRIPCKEPRLVPLLTGRGGGFYNLMLRPLPVSFQRLFRGGRYRVAVIRPLTGPSAVEAHLFVPAVYTTDASCMNDFGSTVHSVTLRNSVYNLLICSQGRVYPGVASTYRETSHVCRRVSLMCPRLDDHGSALRRGLCVFCVCRQTLLVYLTTLHARWLDLNGLRKILAHVRYRGGCGRTALVGGGCIPNRVLMVEVWVGGCMSRCPGYPLGGFGLGAWVV